MKWECGFCEGSGETEINQRERDQAIEWCQRLLRDLKTGESVKLMGGRCNSKILQDRKIALVEVDGAMTEETQSLDEVGICYEATIWISKPRKRIYTKGE